mmetsp:Transcript_24331/g.62189  ORF Transcript_24331/g.62189 Transcript_24331/m.62189 type:complete len:295 (+) Transcript_24331:351-1235(+)
MCLDRQGSHGQRSKGGRIQSRAGCHRHYGRGWRQEGAIGADRASVFDVDRAGPSSAGLGRCGAGGRAGARAGSALLGGLRAPGRREDGRREYRRTGPRAGGRERLRGARRPAARGLGLARCRHRLPALATRGSLRRRAGGRHAVARTLQGGWRSRRAGHRAADSRELPRRAEGRRSCRDLRLRRLGIIRGDRRRLRGSARLEVARVLGPDAGRDPRTQAARAADRCQRRAGDQRGPGGETTSRRRGLHHERGAGLVGVHVDAHRNSESEHLRRQEHGATKDLHDRPASEQELAA